MTATLTAGGDETLHNMRLALQAPQGWTVKAVGRRDFSDVPPSSTPTATFSVTPPDYARKTNAVLHAIALLGPAATREAGATVTVAP